MSDPQISFLALAAAIQPQPFRFVTGNELWRIGGVPMTAQDFEWAQAEMMRIHLEQMNELFNMERFYD